MSIEKVLSGEQRWCVERGDSCDVLRCLPNDSVDALVTDPPSGIGFLGRSWDSDKGGRDQWISWLAVILRECVRVLKPGGHAVVWALPRTSSWTGRAVEDAGFEIRDVIAHLFGSGMPKSVNLGGGFGSGMKPSSEHWILARKPVAATLRSNFATHGTGGVNIDACRVPHASAADLAHHEKGVNAIKARGGSMSESWKNSSDLSGANDVNALGRWPANAVLDHCSAEVVDEQSGDRPGMSGGGKHRADYAGGMFGGIDSTGTARGDTGGASRFFNRFDLDPEEPLFLYCPKPSKAETEAGCDHLPLRSVLENVGRDPESAGAKSGRAGAGRSSGRHNHHPTKKPLSLMKWLCRLVAPPGGLILDPFCGSGTTGCAATLEGFRFVGVDLDSDDAGKPHGYVDIARARIAHWEAHAIELAKPPAQTSLMDLVGGVK